MNQARAETEAIRDEIMAEGRIRKRALEISRIEVRHTVDALRAERERLGLSLADLEARSGLKRSALSRLENDPTVRKAYLYWLLRGAATGCAKPCGDITVRIWVRLESLKYSGSDRKV